MKRYTTFYLDEDIIQRLDREKNKSAIVNSALRVYLRLEDELPPKKKSVAAVVEKVKEVCSGHPGFRRNCGLKGCKYV